MGKIIIVEPPINCWSKGYPICEGNNTSSINMTTVFAKNNKIIPVQNRLRKSFYKLRETLRMVGYEVIVLPFPDLLNSSDCLHHDGVFFRDVGFMFKNKWIKSNFSVKNRQIEAEIYAEIIRSKFEKEIVVLPDGAFLEFGEVYYNETVKGSFYFGGLSRANKIGHNFVKSIIAPDNYVLIESKGYHLDTVFTPVLSSNNELVAIIVAKDMLRTSSFEKLEKLNIEIIIVKNSDSSGEDGLGNYAINCLAGKGFLIGGSHFSTPGVEDRLKELNIDFHVVPLIDFNFAGGSVHCLTNELNS